MLKTRIITAVFALAVMLGVFILGNPQLMPLVFMILVGISVWELATMLFPRIYIKFSANHDTLAPAWLRPVLVVLSCLMFAVSVYSERHGLGAIMLGLLGGLILGIFLAPEIDLAFGAASGILICFVYGIFPWLAISELYKFAPDSRYIYLTCAIVWSGDTGAYFSGRKFGKHKLAPSMSPNKTWEGSVGGIVFSIIGASCLKLYYGSELIAWPIILVCSVVGGILGQLGDLTESAFKRFSGVKDSGKILPGHGGFLDRVDGLLFAAPAVWFILYQIGI